MKAYTGWSQHAFLIIQYMTVFVCPCHYQSKALFLRHLVDCLAPFTHTSLTQFLHVSTSTAAPFPVTLDGTLRHQEALKRTDARRAGTAVDHCVTHSSTPPKNSIFPSNAHSSCNKGQSPSGLHAGKSGNSSFCSHCHARLHVAFSSVKFTALVANEAFVPKTTVSVR